MASRSKDPWLTRWVGTLALLLGVAVQATCGGTGRPFLLVTVSGGDGSSTNSLKVTAQVGNQTFTPDAEISNSERQFFIWLPQGASGSAQVEVQEIAQLGCIIDEGTGQATIVPTGETDVSVPLSCPGGMCQPCTDNAHLVVNPNSIMFGVVDLTKTPMSTLTVQNTGIVATGPLTVSSPQEPPDAGTTTSAFSSSSSNCANNELQSTASCQVQVSFQPTVYGMQSATLAVSGSPGGTVIVPITGIGRDSVQLTVDEPGNGSGMVTAPVGMGTISGSGINCPSSGADACSQSYYRTTSIPEVTLSETPVAGSLFAGWSGGGCSGTGTTCTVPLSAPNTVTATFTLCNTTAHCGNSCSACSASPANASPACNSGACGFTCNSGYVNCGGTCYSDTATNPNHCGTTCTNCTTPANASPTCANGTCGFTCNTGYTNCGSLCKMCPAGPAGSSPTCTNGSCGWTCNGGYIQCGSDCTAVSGCGPTCANPNPPDCSDGYQCSNGTCVCPCKPLNCPCGTDGCCGGCNPKCGNFCC